MADQPTHPGAWIHAFTAWAHARTDVLDFDGAPVPERIQRLLDGHGLELIRPVRPVGRGRVMFDEDLGPLLHCGLPPRLRRSGVRWEGNFAIVDADLDCALCGAELTLTTRRDVGPPDGGA